MVFTETYRDVAHGDSSSMRSDYNLMTKNGQRRKSGCCSIKYSRAWVMSVNTFVQKKMHILIEDVVSDCMSREQLVHMIKKSQD